MASFCKSYGILKPDKAIWADQVKLSKSPWSTASTGRIRFRPQTPANPGLIIGTKIQKNREYFLPATTFSPHLTFDYKKVEDVGTPKQFVCFAYMWKYSNNRSEWNAKFFNKMRFYYLTLSSVSVHVRSILQFSQNSIETKSP